MHNDSGLIHYTDEVQLTRALKHTHTLGALLLRADAYRNACDFAHASEHLKPDAAARTLDRLSLQMQHARSPKKEIW
jgi:hypothetical protein